MMFELELERKIRDFRELGLPRYFRRDGEVPLVENTVTTILGARRAGKSYRQACRPLGIEITAQDKISLAAINRVTKRLGLAAVKRADFAPLPAG